MKSSKNSPHLQKKKITINYSGRLVLLSNGKAYWLWQYMPYLHMLNTVSVIFYHQILYSNGIKRIISWWNPQELCQPFFFKEANLLILNACYQMRPKLLPTFWANSLFVLCWSLHLKLFVWCNWMPFKFLFASFWTCNVWLHACSVSIMTM